MPAALQRKAPPLRGYLFGVRAAAAYVGVDRKAFRGWRDDPNMPNRELLQPRIIRGKTYYSIARLDKFMDPASNPPDAEIMRHFLSRD